MINLLSFWPMPQQPIMPWLWLGLIVFGLALGSFANVVIVRLPKMLNQPEDMQFNLCWPNSHCVTCQHPLKWWHNIPLVSYLLLRGRCAFCQAGIPPSYPLVELAMMLMVLMVVMQYGLSVRAMGAIVFCGLLLCMVVIDWRSQLLPDSLNYTLLWLGLLLSLTGLFATPTEAIVGAASGYVVFWLIGWAFFLLRGKWGLGYGDYKLLAALGAWLGWQWLPFVVFIAATLATLFAVIGMLLKRLAWQSVLAFGPFLAIAGVSCLFFGHQLLTLGSSAWGV